MRSVRWPRSKPRFSMSAEHASLTRRPFSPRRRRERRGHDRPARRRTGATPVRTGQRLGRRWGEPWGGGRTAQGSSMGFGGPPANAFASDFASSRARRLRAPSAGGVRSVMGRMIGTAGAQLPCTNSGRSVALPNPTGTRPIYRSRSQTRKKGSRAGHAGPQLFRRDRGRRRGKRLDLRRRGPE